MNHREMLSLEGKVAIVTGGGRGIGRFIATGLAEAGAHLVIASRKLEGCQKAADELAKLGHKVLPVQCDMANAEHIEKLLQATMAEFGTVDVLVNNAGITWGSPTLEYPLDKWDKIFAVNVRGVWILTQKVANVMKDKGGGRIINISSIFGSRGSSEMAHPAVAYNSSKGAVELLTKNLAIKLAPYGITVNAIAPGFFKTDMMAYLWKPEMQMALDLMLNYVPAHRAGEEDDIKALAVFLASGASRYVTGAVIPLDGGLQAQ